MNSIRRLIQLSLVTIILGVAPTAQAAPNLDFELVNKTGFDIKAVYIAPNNQEDWEENILEGVLDNGETLEVSFEGAHTIKKWDVKVIWTDNDTAYWRGYDLTKLSKLTLFYNVETNVASARAE